VSGISGTVLITGAAKGIGRAVAEAFAEDGYNVIINYLNSEAQALELEKQLGSRGFAAAACRADVTDRRQVDAMVGECVRRFGQIHVLVNNAGIARQRLFSDIKEAEWDEMFGVHVKGAYNCCQSVLPQMISRKQGKIINISSIWGITGASCEVHYSAAKAALIGFTKALAKELGPSNIQVNCVAPGMIETDMNRFLTDEDRRNLAEETPLMRFGKPREVADAVLFLASGKADFITGQVLSPNGGFVV
jgi:3-oxoacyl-[acyl-carrier protein] reductase